MNSYDILVLDEAKAFIKAMSKSAQKKLVKAMDYVRMGSIKKDYFKKLTGTDDIMIYGNFVLSIRISGIG